MQCMFLVAGGGARWFLKRSVTGNAEEITVLCIFSVSPVCLCFTAYWRSSNKLFERKKLGTFLCCKDSTRDFFSRCYVCYFWTWIKGTSLSVFRHLQLLAEDDGPLTDKLGISFPEVNCLEWAPIFLSSSEHGGGSEGLCRLWHRLEGKYWKLNCGGPACGWVGAAACVGVVLMASHLLSSWACSRRFIGPILGSWSSAKLYLAQESWSGDFQLLVKLFSTHDKARKLVL